MEVPTQEGEMPLPINSTYGGGHGHMIHHDHSAPQMPTNGLMSSALVEDHPPVLPYKKVVKYRECLKNHAAAMGGNATDGCGEFMPSGEEGTLEALTCSACNCHRNFHRKEVEGEPSLCDCCYPNPHHHLNRVGKKVIVGHHHHLLLHHDHHHKSILGHESFGYHAGTLIPSRGVAAAQPHQMIMSYNMGGGPLPSESDEQEDFNGGVVMARPPYQLVKKRFRTKFTPEQKEKMLQFAEKVGWKIQKQEESVVQQFCQEVGVKRRVLKVWMHNNKHNLAKKDNNNSINVENQFREEGMQQN